MVFAQPLSLTTQLLDCLSWVQCACCAAVVGEQLHMSWLCNSADVAGACFAQTKAAGMLAACFCCFNHAVGDGCVGFGAG
jgi:hypothetical protein